ncbi:hypothetical protein CsSME_00007247 [Camellia sinensis var. sinensis]
MRAVLHSAKVDVVCLQETMMEGERFVGWMYLPALGTTSGVLCWDKKVVEEEEEEEEKMGGEFHLKGQSLSWIDQFLVSSDWEEHFSEVV